MTNPSARELWGNISIKSLGKYPHIRISEQKIDELYQWFCDNHLSMLVPPVFQEFVIELGDAAQMLILYTTSRTSYHGIVWRSDKKYLYFFVDYASSTPDPDSPAGWKMSVAKEKISASILDDNAMDNYVTACFATVALVQSYIMYHRPDVSDEPPKERHISSEPRQYIQRPRKPITIRSSVARTIVIGSDEHPPRKYNYRTMAWQVRGYYEHVGHDKHLVFIAPHIRKRSEKKRKIKPQTYIVEK